MESHQAGPAQSHSQVWRRFGQMRVLSVNQFEFSPRAKSVMNSPMNFDPIVFAATATGIARVPRPLAIPARPTG